MTCATDKRGTSSFVVDEPEEVATFECIAMLDQSGKDRECLCGVNLLGALFPQPYSPLGHEARAGQWLGHEGIEEKPPQAWGAFPTQVCTLRLNML